MEMTLRLPSTYVDVERDEMEYVDGGFSWTNTWYGSQIYLNERDLDIIADVMTAAAWAGATFSGYCWMISAGLAVPTFGMGAALAGTIASVAAFSSAVVGLGAWAIDHFSSLTIPLLGIKR